MSDDEIYRRIGNKISDQAEPTSENRGAGRVDMRVLIELQVISMLLHEGFGVTDDLAKLRQSVADSIT